MKKLLLPLCATIMLTSCSNESDNSTPIKTQVMMTFSPYEMSAITRTPTSIADVCTRLDLWIDDGTTTTDIHQTTSDNLGTISVTLDRTKTYTLYAVAHKCDAEATLSDGVISFPDDRTTHALYYSTQFSPSSTTTLNCVMQRIVSMFRLETTDPVPTSVKKMRFTIAGIYDRWSVTTGPIHPIDRVSTVTITSTRQDGSVAISIYAITTDSQTLHDVTVEALDADDAPVSIYTHVFPDVPLRNGYKTTYRGDFFTAESMTMTFTVDDWNEYEVVDF